MKDLFLVTGNAGKLREWKRLLPARIPLKTVGEDLPEIQSIDLEEIVRDKARRAFSVVGKPVVVEDISAGLEELNGLPGPFIKDFEKKLGLDALHKMARSDAAPAVVTCSIGYYDGKNEFTVKAEVTGTAVPERGENGFGFDKCFMPSGQGKTYGEMTPQEKDAVSHRSKAIALFVNKLDELKL